MPEEVILVTGVSGYIATHVAKVLLENGYRVKGTVRSLENATKVDPLKNLVPEAQHSLELVEADLTKDDGWDKAMEGCSAVMHMASPFPPAMRDPKEEDLIIPAKEGTLRVLKHVVKAKIKKVILTSSVASVVNLAELSPDPDKVYTEEDWVDPDAPTIDAYSKSKVLAEKAAWDFLKELPDDEKFELVVINPGLVMGPVLMEHHKDCTSVEFLTDIMNKVYPAVPRFNINFCDVRDVAMAHMKALTVPEAAGCRHIISSGSLFMKDANEIIAKEFSPQGYSIATGQLPDFACWVAGFFNKMMKSYVIPRIGKIVKFDNKRMVEVLGIQPTPLETSFIDMAYSLVDFGIVKKAKKYKQVGSRAEVQATDDEKNVDASQEANMIKKMRRPEMRMRAKTTASKGEENSSD